MSTQYLKLYDQSGHVCQNEIVFYPDEMDVMLTGVTGGPFKLNESDEVNKYIGQTESYQHGKMTAWIAFSSNYRKILSVRLVMRRWHRDEDSGECYYITNEYRSQW